MNLYRKNITTLVLGTGIAQLIPVLFSPLLTRLYSPESFGAFAMYISVSALLAIFVGGRYELAVVVPTRLDSARAMVQLCGGIALVTSIAVWLLFYMLEQLAYNPFGQSAEGGWYYFAPVGALLMVWGQALYYLNNREGVYPAIAQSKIAHSVVTVVVQSIIGWLLFGSAGLIYGYMLGQLTTIVVLMRAKGAVSPAPLAPFKKMRDIAREYSNFPRFLILSHGLNAASAHAPVLALSIIFGAKITGFYLLAQRVVGAPTTMISGAIGDVFRQEASEHYRLKGECKAVYLTALKRLVIVSTLPFLIAYFIAPYAFAFLFGEQWRVAGEYLQLVLPMMYLRFITSPLSAMFFIAEKQRVDLALTSALITLVSCALMIGYSFDSPEIMLLSYSIVYCLIYLVGGWITYTIAKGQGVVNASPKNDQ